MVRCALCFTKDIEENDVTPLLFLADLLMTDASSVSSEYSLLDRPMVFLDVPKLLAKVAEKPGFVDQETQVVGGVQAGPFADGTIDIDRFSAGTAD